MKFSFDAVVSVNIYLYLLCYMWITYWQNQKYFQIALSIPFWIKHFHICRFWGLRYFIEGIFMSRYISIKSSEVSVNVITILRFCLKIQITILDRQSTVVKNLNSVLFTLCVAFKKCYCYWFDISYNFKFME